MKIGFVLECSQDGPDAKIYPDILKSLCQLASVSKPRTLGKKNTLLIKGHINAKDLLADGCDYVFIIWDRKPGWGGNTNCEEDKQSILANLKLINADTTKVRLCCIDEMLESWLIADSRGFNAWTKTITTRQLKKLPDLKSKAEQSNAENRIRVFFRENYSAWNFNKFTDSIKIYRNLPELSRARKWNYSFDEYCTFIEEICQ
jgi:hypothetical protein